MSDWLKRLDLLRSISLEGIAQEINARRVAENQGEAVARDKRAGARRMQRALVAIHEILGQNRTWVVTVEVIARQMHVGERTARRALSDLEQACLVEITRRERARRRGGQGPSEYRLVWPNLLDLAESQGLQPSLDFPPEDAPQAGGAEAVIAESDRPDGPSGPPQPARGRAPGHSGRAPGHSGRAPGHSGRAPGHSGRALRGAHAPVPLSSPHFKSPPPPPSGNPGDGGEEEEGGRFLDLHLEKTCGIGWRVTALPEPARRSTKPGPAAGPRARWPIS